LHKTGKVSKTFNVQPIRSPLHKSTLCYKTYGHDLFLELISIVTVEAILKHTKALSTHPVFIVLEYHAQIVPTIRENLIFFF